MHAYSTPSRATVIHTCTSPVDRRYVVGRLKSRCVGLRAIRRESDLLAGAVGYGTVVRHHDESGTTRRKCFHEVKYQISISLIQCSSWLVCEHNFGVLQQQACQSNT